MIIKEINEKNKLIKKLNLSEAKMKPNPNPKRNSKYISQDTHTVRPCVYVRNEEVWDAAGQKKTISSRRRV